MNGPRLGGVLPRRAALRTTSGLGAAMFAVLGLRSVTEARKAKRGKRGPAGPQGPQGPPGLRGELTLVFGDQTSYTIEAGQSAEPSSDCPDGDGSIPINASYRVTNPLCQVISMEPLGTRGWSMFVTCPTGQASPNNLMRAICLQIR
jgi:hypothetical protein